MQYSIVEKSKCEKYDFGHLLFSPEFFLQDKLANWEILDAKADEVVSDYFFHVRDTVNDTDEKIICYDLADALSKFLNDGIQTTHIGSTKKVARKGDFVISRLRSYLEQMAIVEERALEQLFSSEFLVFRAKTDQISTYTLFALCMTKIVQTILKRGQYGTEHPRFYDFLLTDLPVPACLLVIDPYVKQTVQKALAIRKLSKDFYTQAQTLLLTELGLTDWQPAHRLTFVKNLSDTGCAERVDAEYFQPKYDEIINGIKNYAGGYDTLGNLTTLKKCVEVGSKEYLETGIPFVRVSNLSPFEITQEKHISEELYAELTEHQPKQGEILFSKDATPGIAHYLREIPEKMIPSSGILRLNSKTDKIGNEYLTLVLNSILTQEQVHRDVGGSVILHWRPDQVAGTVIPILHEDKQTEIEQKVIESFNGRKRAKDLLEHAKRAVEIAIEQGEQAAIDRLESVVGKL